MDDKKNKKKYVIPEAELVDFANNDIITVSGRGLLGDIGEDEDGEDFPL